MTWQLDLQPELNVAPEIRERAKTAAQVWSRARGRAVVAAICAPFIARIAVLMVPIPGEELSISPLVMGIAALTSPLFILLFTLAPHHGFGRGKLSATSCAILTAAVAYEIGWFYIPPKLGFEVGLFWPTLTMLVVAAIAFETWHIRKSAVPGLLFSIIEEEECELSSSSLRKQWYTVVFWLFILLSVAVLWIVISQN